MPQESGRKSGGRSNTLGLSDRDLDALATKLTEPDSGMKPSAAREFTRFGFRKTLVVLELIHPGGNVVRLPVVSLNLSKRGIGLLHSSYVHEGSKCSVCLSHPHLQWIRVGGEVVRCNHRGGKVHEIGVQFDEEIDTREVLSLDPMGEEWSLERVDPERLSGRLLVLDDDDLLQRLVAGLLKATNLEVIHAMTVDEALEHAPGCDLILCDFHLEGESGADFAIQLRDRGLTVPVLLMTGDRTSAAKDSMRQAGAVGFLSKPLERTKLIRALAEHLLSDGAEASDESTLSKDDPRQELIEPFVAGLGGLADQLDKHSESDDYELMLGICRQLAGQAPSLGFRELGSMAEEAMTRLTATMSVLESARELTNLAEAARRARPAAA